METHVLIKEAVRQKTLELCDTIVRQPQFQNIRQRVESFLADAGAQRQYQSLTEKGRSLHERQHQGLALDGREVAAFDSERDAFLGNPVAKGFLDAQEEIRDLQNHVQECLTRTFDLGRVPSAEELQEGCCGSDCGCHH